MAGNRIPVLLDTDIGSNVDDAVCLAYLLCQPGCELLGITTVTGEPQKRAMMADALCRAAGADIPIHAGVENPLLVAQKQKTAPQAAVVDEWPHAEHFPPDEAVSFLRDTIRSRPGEITLLTIGPLTNIGVLFSSDPEIPMMLKRLVLMCGVFSQEMTNSPESNASVDPHATAVVFKAPVPSLLSVGLDVTGECTMSAEEFRRRFRGGVLDVVASFAGVWLENKDSVTFNDPLAASLIFEPDICSYESGHIEIELARPGQRGKTLWTSRKNGLHEIAVKVDSDKFFNHYFDVVGAGEA